EPAGRDELPPQQPTGGRFAVAVPGTADRFRIAVELAARGGAARRRFRPAAAAVEACRRGLAGRIAGSPAQARSMNTVAIAPSLAGTPMLELRKVEKSFGDTEIIRGVSLAVKAGERHAVIGPNGAGKSTLFHLISGSLPLTQGEILLEDQAILGLKPFEINRRGLARSFQITNVFPGLSVFENIRCAILWTLGRDDSMFASIDRMPDVDRHANEVLERIGLSRRARVEAGYLTYAEQRALE